MSVIKPFLALLDWRPGPGQTQVVLWAAPLLTFLQDPEVR